MADAKAQVLESEINMLRDEVKSLRLLLSEEEVEVNSKTKKKIRSKRILRNII